MLCREGAWGQANCLQVPYKSTHIYQSSFAWELYLMKRSSIPACVCFVYKANKLYLFYYVCKFQRGIHNLYTSLNIPLGQRRECFIACSAAVDMQFKQFALNSQANPMRKGGVYATSFPSSKLCCDAGLNINFLDYSQFKQFIL